MRYAGKFTFFILCILILLPNYSFSQSDSLFSKSYKELGVIMEQKSTPELSIKAGEVYLEKAKKERNIENQWRGYVSLTNLYINSNNYKRAIKYADSTTNFIKQHNLPQFEYHTFLAAGQAYYGKGILNSSLEYYQKALSIAKHDNNLKNIQTASYFITLIKSTSGNYEEAINAQQEFITFIKKADSTSQLSKQLKEQLIFISETSIADAYVNAKNPDSAYYYSNRVLQKALKVYDSCVIKQLYWQMGSAELLQKKYAKARKSFEYSKKYCLPPTKFDKLVTGAFLGKVYAGQKKYKAAIIEFEKAFASYDIDETEEGFMDDFYKVLALSYKEEGDIVNANLYFEKYINTIQTKGKIDDTINNSLKNQELTRFRNDLEKLRLEKEKKESTLNYTLLIASIVILILLSYLLKFYKIKKNNEKKFDALIAKINAAKKPKEIINTKDDLLEEQNIMDVSEEIKMQIINGLNKLEIKEYYLKQECTSYTVAKKIGTNTTYLSKIINSHYGKNFNTYINDLRINYAIIRLKDDVFFRSYSIQSIAEELGYKSANSFTKYFKNTTGLNPSFYIKNIKNIV